MFNRMLVYFVIVSTIFFFGCIIKGRVVDENGAGVAGVTVSLSGTASMTATTDSNGNYKFGTINNMLSVGSYTVTPSGFGCSFSPASANVGISNGVLGELGDVPLPASVVDLILNNCATDVTLVTLGDSLTAGDGDDRAVGIPCGFGT